MNKDRLSLWQETLHKAESSYSMELEKMDGREKLYLGREELIPIVDGQKAQKTEHVHNIIAENIDSEVNNDLPAPKVTARRPEDEERARLIEDLIRSECERMPMKEINDMLERMVPIQGGGYMLLEWDDTIGTYYRAGENVAQFLHPKQVIPQPGVMNIDDMDYVIIKQPETKGYVKRRWGADVEDESESEPEVRLTEDEGGSEDDMVTVYTAYYKDDDGNICKYVWCNNVELEDLEDYQAKRHKRCLDCGAPLPLDDEKIRHLADNGNEKAAEKAISDAMGELAQDLGADEEISFSEPEEKEEKTVCPYCGSGRIKVVIDDHEEIIRGFTTRQGIVIPDAQRGIGKNGKPAMIPTMIPAYKPDKYPVVLQRNITVYGRLLGDSDVDRITPQQNALNWHMKKIDDRLLGAGSVIVLPKNSNVDIDPKDNRIWRVDNVSDLSLVKVLDFASNLQYNFTQTSACYESARQILGITDSFQGRHDTTATSGKAKEFAAAQSAGRLESKRMMKAAAWAQLFELIFKFTLAYADEPRQISSLDKDANPVYKVFDRWDFLDQDPKTGEYFWDDDFIFGVDSAAALAANRTAMWQECRDLFSAGTYGDPGNIQTRLLFWSEMERLHHPLAANAKRFIQDQIGSVAPAMGNGVPGMGTPAEMPAEESMGMNAGGMYPNIPETF